MSKLMLITSFLERISNGDVAVTSDQFPNFLYNEDEAEDITEENPDDWDAEKGLLRSSLCLWVSCLIFMLQILWAQFIESYKCIFMGNGSWKPSDKKRKGPISKINGMTQVTPATIAYAVAQVCFTLCIVSHSMIFRHALLCRPARNGVPKTANLFYRTSIRPFLNFLTMKTTSGLLTHWHGGMSMLSIVPPVPCTNF